jgi:hypothetical protein
MWRHEYSQLPKRRVYAYYTIGDVQNNIYTMIQSLSKILIFRKSILDLYRILSLKHAHSAGQPVYRVIIIIIICGVGLSP